MSRKGDAMQMLTETIRFMVPLPPVQLRRNRETMHKGYRAALVRQYGEAVWIAGYGVKAAFNGNGALYRDLPWEWVRGRLRRDLCPGQSALLSIIVY